MRTAVVVLILLGLANPQTPVARSVVLSTGSAAVGTQIRATGTGWPAGQLVQLVTCGQLALAGSASCDMRTAVATVARADGGFTVELTVGDPPVPCPCVVHTASVGSGPALRVDTPVDLPGHATAAVPTPGVAPVAAEVVEARLAGGNTLAGWFGGVRRPELVYAVRNTGATDLTDLPLTVRFGRGEETVPVPPTGTIRPGETKTFRIPLTVPFAAFGAYPVTADIGGLGQAGTSLQAYPWGLVGLNLAGLALIVLGLARRRRRPLPSGEGLPAVVRVPALDAFVVFDDAPIARRLARVSGAQLAPGELKTLLDKPSAPQAIVDLAALRDHLEATVADVHPERHRG
ncbi:hypothetical protein [Hamadaea tsunoensis]|uniref:hypothetical protein n=1 Tax=Hamadaea tsunoensis TaxID=53368 RepID=UPI0004291508|nr:hypothetical protein [Hamadaea tsunoensis]